MRQLLGLPVFFALLVAASVLLPFGITSLVSGDFGWGVMALALFPGVVFLFVRWANAMDRWGELRDANEMFLQRYVGTPIFMFLVCGFIYPGVLLLTRWSSTNRGDRLASCTAFSHATVGIILLCELVALIGWAVLFRVLNNGMLALLQAVPWGVLMATWFATGGLGVMLCTPLPKIRTIYPLLHMYLLLLAAYSIVWLHRRLPRTIELNPSVYDFEKVQLAIFDLVARPDRGLVRQRDFVYFILCFGGVPLAVDYVLGLTVPKRFVRDWEFVILETAIAYVFLIVAASGISTAWHVARRCHGQKLTIKEFSPPDR